MRARARTEARRRTGDADDGEGDGARVELRDGRWWPAGGEDATRRLFLLWYCSSSTAEAGTGARVTPENV